MVMKAIDGLWVIASLAGCGTDDGVPHRVEVAASVCLHATDPNMPGTGVHQFMAGRSVYAVAELDTPCLSSSCDVDREAVCAFTLGALHEVTAFASWTDVTASEHVCTDDCGRLFAICQTEPLAAATYTFVHAGRSTQLAIPSQTSTPPCL
jgi:hypothetical protein